MSSEHSLPISPKALKRLAAVGIIFDPNRYFSFRGRKLRHRPLDSEPTNSSYPDFTVKSAPEFTNDNSRDLAEASLAPWTHTPPQFLISQFDETGQEIPQLITDLPKEGEGWLVAHLPDGTTQTHYYNSENPKHIYTQFTYPGGTHICWFAGQKGLVFNEVWSPPFASSKVEDLSFDDPQLPPSFKSSVSELLEQEFLCNNHKQH